MFKVIAGPCAIENEHEFVEFSTELAFIATHYPVELIIKGSFDKANRTLPTSPRGVGLDRGLKALHDAGRASMCRVTTDVHECWQVPLVAQVVDIIQIPAFLCRQTDLLSAAATSGRIVNVKRGQFATYSDLVGIGCKVDKAPEHWVTYRGQHSIGAARPICDVGDMAMVAGMFKHSLLDITHTNNEQYKLSELLARVAKPLGFSGIFAEVHPNPREAISDRQNQLDLSNFRRILDTICHAR